MALEESECSASRSYRFNPEKRGPGAYWIRGWVGSSAGLDAVAKRIPIFQSLA